MGRHIRMRREYIDGKTATTSKREVIKALISPPTCVQEITKRRLSGLRSQETNQ